MKNDIKEVLLDEVTLAKRIKEMGEEISKDYAGKEIIVIGILKGSVVFVADLVREITLPVSFDFMAVSSYGARTTTTGTVRILKDLDYDIEGKHVLIVEDIIDSGVTLSYLIEHLAGRKPASLKLCTLLSKPGGYLSNDRFPPGIFLDNIPSWEYGVLVQVRDLTRALRHVYRRELSLMRTLPGDDIGIFSLN